MAKSIHRRLLVILLPTLAMLIVLSTLVQYWMIRTAHHQKLLLSSTILMDFLQLDLTLLLVWLGVHYGLRPLQALRNELENHSPRELPSFDASAVPIEVRSLVAALNSLFALVGAAEKAQRQFVADTAHQLRTPVAGVLGQLELLMLEAPDATAQTRLTALHQAMLRIARSINQLLALARAEPAATSGGQFATVELKPLAEQVVARNVDRSIQARVDLSVELQPAAVRGGTRLLEDLLDNLLDNALNYTPASGHVIVRCGIEGTRPFLEVEDDGPGIPESERARVRERFYRPPGSPGTGCGLGLAIVQDIARAHGAEFTIETGSQGRGCRMRVCFARTV